MSKELIGLVEEQNQDLSISFNDILEIFVYSEMAISHNHPWPWEDDDLAKRRKAYQFDENLQELLLFKGVHNFTSKKIECGNKSFYRCELQNSKGGIIHIGNSFQKSVYLNDYIKMNSDNCSPSYIYLQYTLNNEKNKVEKISIRIPYPNKKDNLQDITESYNIIRSKLLSIVTSEKQLIEFVYPT